MTIYTVEGKIMRKAIFSANIPHAFQVTQTFIGALYVCPDSLEVELSDGIANLETNIYIEALYCIAIAYEPLNFIHFQLLAENDRVRLKCKKSQGGLIVAESFERIVIANFGETNE